MSTVIRAVPADGATELDWLLFEQAGVLTWQQAVSLTSPSRVRHLLESGRWQRICRGVLVANTGELSRGQQLWVAVLAAGPGAVLAGATAVGEAGVRGVRQEPLFVLLPGARIAPDLRRRLPLGMPAVVVRRTTWLPDDHVQPGRPARTGTPRSVVDAAQWARTDQEARTVVAAACQQRRVTTDELCAVLDTMPRARRRRLILQTAQDAAGGAQALSEIDLVRLCRRHGLPAPQLQERRTDSAGRIRYLDAYWQRWRLHAEVDGAHHMDVRHWAADMRRQYDVWIAGDRILRFPAWLVRERPAEVAAQIEAALRAAGWRP